MIACHEGSPADISQVPRQGAQDFPDATHLGAVRDVARRGAATTAKFRAGHAVQVQNRSSTAPTGGKCLNVQDVPRDHSRTILLAQFDDAPPSAPVRLGSGNAEVSHRPDRPVAEAPHRSRCVDTTLRASDSCISRRDIPRSFWTRAGLLGTSPAETATFTFPGYRHAAMSA